MASPFIPCSLRSPSVFLLLLVVVCSCAKSEVQLQVDDCRPYNRTVNGELLKCSMCYPGNLRIAHCNKTEDTLCGPCPNGTYNTGCSIATECTLCTLYCDPVLNTEIVVECTPFNDTQCDCKEGYWRHPDLDINDPCIPFKACGPGYGAAEGSKRANTVCSVCANGTFSNLTVNFNQLCKSWTITKCEGSMKYRPGDTTTDSTCVNETAVVTCPPGETTLPAIANGKLTCNDYIYGSTCKYQCNENYTIPSSQQSMVWMERQCTVMGSWTDGNTPKCKEKVPPQMHNCSSGLDVIADTPEGSLVTIPKPLYIGSDHQIISPNCGRFSHQHSYLLHIGNHEVQCVATDTELNTTERCTFFVTVLQPPTNATIIVIIAVITVFGISGMAVYLCHKKKQQLHERAKAGPLLPATIEAPTITPDCPSNNNRPSELGKLHDDSSYAYNILRLNDVIPSIGIITSNLVSVQGSCVRVGTCYVMTCYHVIADIMGIPLGQSPSQEDFIKLVGKRPVEVRFSFNVPQRHEGDPNLLDPAFPLAWCAPDLDVVILKLATPSSSNGIHPVQPVTRFCNIHPLSQEVWILGHPGGDAKKYEKCDIVSDDKIQDIMTWASSNNIDNWYEAADNTDVYVSYNSKMEHGASGSPCFIIDPEYGAAVAAIHARAYPEVNKRKDIAIECTFEQGVKTNVIYQRLVNENLLLCQDIFREIL